ncbi:hypothetical protein K227x_58890 [Rubripirellula lacrimiformis]|uniref:Uncharacterized protein n=1 Tax=Rubripirellula lacrimiformis TaxID=1930273 RepID=A0A517NK08_9BACT|nr:hypothetical protein K227x_58890 [Rubripirellula lacrimiformis]
MGEDQGNLFGKDKGSRTQILAVASNSPETRRLEPLKLDVLLRAEPVSPPDRREPAADTGVQTVR